MRGFGKHKIVILCQRAGKLTDLYQITYHSIDFNNFMLGGRPLRGSATANYYCARRAVGCCVPARTIPFPKKESMDFVPVFGKFLSLPYEKLLSLPPVTIFANSFVS